MNAPLEIKISMKDVEPIKEFLGSVAEFQKAIFKLSGKSIFEDEPITRKKLEQIGFMVTILGHNYLISKPDRVISIQIAFEGNEVSSCFLSTRTDTITTVTIPILENNPTMKDVNTLLNILGA